MSFNDISCSCSCSWDCGFILVNLFLCYSFGLWSWNKTEECYVSLDFSYKQEVEAPNKSQYCL